jgi:hypothetical protein
MSNVIRFLETMGSKQLPTVEYEATVAALELDATHRQALLDCDPAQLNDLLGGRNSMCCLVVAAETPQ